MPGLDRGISSRNYQGGDVALYIGPDSMMPIASAFAAIAGVAVMFWNRTVAIFKGIGRAIGRVAGRGN